MNKNDEKKVKKENWKMINNINPIGDNENIMPFGNNMAMPYENTMAMPYENVMAVPFENTMAMPYDNNMMMPQQVMPQQMMPNQVMPQQCNPAMVSPQVNCPFMQSGYPMPIQPMYYPMVTMPEEQLEKMYPKTYQIVNPVVQSYCDKMDVMSNPTKEQLNEMCEKICKEVEADVEKAIAAENKDEKRQLGFGGRAILRDLAGILLLRELIRRRRVFGYPGYGFPSYGYPGYGGFYGY